MGGICRFWHVPTNGAFATIALRDFHPFLNVNISLIAKASVQIWLNILCYSCCFYFVSLLIHVFSLFISTSAVFISFHTIHYPLAQRLPSSFVPFCAILSVYFHPFGSPVFQSNGSYYRPLSFLRDCSFPIINIPLHQLLGTPWLLWAAQSTRKGINAVQTPLV